MIKNWNEKNHSDPDWRAPESDVTPAFDVYSLGRIFCFILSQGLFPTNINFVEFISFVNQVKEQEPVTFRWSEAMLELVNSMLSIPTKLRPTASQVLHHSVFSSVPSPAESQQSKKKYSNFS
jgi:serine/threonine protein kinase